MKTPAKKATKATAKAPAKVAKPAKKVSAQTATKAKTPLKVAPKAVKKAPAKAAAKNPAKAPVKVVAKASAKMPVKKVSPPKVVAAQKPVAKTGSKVLAPKAPAKTVSAKVAPAAKVAAPKAASKAAAPALAPAKPAVVPQPTAVPFVAAEAAGLPIRSSRPSARLAQITVPSMPQAVASTAAKATFLPSMSTTVLPVPTATAIKKDPKLANNWKNKSVEQLSDAEVLAMPDDEYMNDTQMAFFRLKLVQLKQGILSNAGETTEHLREDTVVVPDPADRATIEEEHALELRTRDRERKLLKKIEQSIARIDAGDYGYCDETGEPIGVGRLLARPTATLSLEAQQRRELKQKMFGD